MAESVKKCAACGVNSVQSPRAKNCPTCALALRKANAALAVYKHRMRSKNGKVRHNRTYGGRPTRWVIARALQVLQDSGVIHPSKAINELAREIEQRSHAVGF